jgi:hypothetical protein
MTEHADPVPFDRFCGITPSPCCRVCGGALGEQSVDSGEGGYATRWIRCSDCGSWSIAWEPEPERLDVFYTDYSVHHGRAAVNKDNNDGRRYTPAWRQTRETEYAFGLTDSELELLPGYSVLDFGAQDSVFLEVCLKIQPDLGRTIAVDYGVERGQQGRHEFQPISDWYEDSDLLDVVTLWDVYEHIPNLEEFLSQLAKRVRTGGQVLIQTPRADLYPEILGPLWHHFLPVQHLQLPTRAGITQQFLRYGFELQKGASFGANAPPSVIPQPYKKLFDILAKRNDQGSTQVLCFKRV